MANQANRDSKTEAIYATAKKIVEAERTQRRLKTDKLRALRLAKEAEIEALPKAKTPRS
jgi:hypothetical protein